jgi:general secretion pathway protein C
MTLAETLSHPRVKQWLPGILNGGMLLLLAASLAHWTWLLVKPPLPALILAPAPPRPAAPAFPVEPLLAAHLFGQASQELSGRRLDNLPLSSLNLVLTGVIAAPNGGYALISVNGQEQEPFVTGQTVTAGAVLHAVYPDRVVIQRNGTLESLLLEGAGQSPPAPQTAAAAAYTPAAAAGNVVRQTSNNHYTVQREQLAAQMRTPDFLRQATMTPASGGGFQVQQLQPGSLYEKLGLRTGDVIKAVNGQPINSAEDAIRLYQEMNNVASAQIEVMRGGKPEYLYYDFTQNP